MMICTFILFSYLITCCTHLVSIEARKPAESSTTPTPIVIHQHSGVHEHLRHLERGHRLDVPAEEPLGGQQERRAAPSRGDRGVLGSGGGSERRIKLHKLMSEQDLRRTFQVDSHDQVPEYEILTISNKLAPEQEEQLLAAAAAASAGAQESEASAGSASVSSELVDNLDQNSKLKRTNNERSKRDLHQTSSSNQNHHPVVKLKLSTFGKEFKLRLKRNVDFQQRIKDMKLLMAESTEDGQLRYTEILAGAKRRKRQDEAEPLLEEESRLQANHTTYHDEENLAALLIDHDRRTGRLQLDGTIGNDFVIKPLPESTARALESGAQADRKSKARSAGAQERPEVSHHIVYRQRPSSEESSEEHKHSFMVSPGGRLVGGHGSMEQIALSFNEKRKSTSERENAIDHGQLPVEYLAAESQEETDFAEDPLGGQFHLEPGLANVSLADGWYLIGGNPRKSLKLLNNQTSTPKEATKNSTTTNKANNAKHRFKRHLYQQRRTNNNSQRMAGSQVRRKRQAPDTVWPEVLLVVDYDSFLLHGGDSRDVKRYFVSFWNGVDLRYKLLVHPHIRISLAGMIVAKDRDATPYLERNRLRAPNADAVDAAGALTDMGKYLYREDRLPTYDLAVVITKLDMCRRRYEGGRCNRGTAGFAYVGGACVVNKRLEKVNSVAIIEDSGGFSGIIVAAHEVGHLLGCVHDGSPPPGYLGGPGATHCPWEDGFIMSDLRHTERGFRWSQCSVEQFKHFLNGETATCLYNYPHESQMLHRLSPGTMLSLDEQCKRDRGTNACFKDARVCAQLFCFDSASGYCVSYRPAAEGSPCGEGQVCRNGKCVGEIENIIPDYTHQSQTIVAPTSGVPNRTPTNSRHSRQQPSLSVVPSRLADNGLSASSTSLKATSSPISDSSSKLFPSSSALLSSASSSVVQQRSISESVLNHLF